MTTVSGMVCYGVPCIGMGRVRVGGYRVAMLSLWGIPMQWVTVRGGVSRERAVLSIKVWMRGVLTRRLFNCVVR